ncbi:TPA: hypothetical protein PC598_004317 [Morganella morganii]|nr:hypothetical protein [Morganella morganii]
MVKQISTHSQEYRGFIIITLPSNATQKVTLYHVTLPNGADSGHSFGKFDALAEAISYIDGLYGDRK